MDKMFYTFKEKFNSINELGWVKSLRKGSTGIGYTFESLIGKEEENFEFPDYNNIEIKTKRSRSNFYITLFNATPDGEELFEIKKIHDRYGYPYYKNKNLKVLNNSVFSNLITNIGVFYKFKLNVNYNDERIYLHVFNLDGKLIDTSTYWSFKYLEEKLERKLKFLAIIYANNKFIDGWEYFKYEKLNLYELKDFKYFILLIDKGLIRVTFKIGSEVDKDGNIKIHDHGTGFDININNIDSLYTKII